MTRETEVKKYAFNREEYLELLTTQEENDYLRDVDLTGADLRNLDFSFMDLNRLNFSNSNCQQAQFNYAKLYRAKFYKADLDFAEFCNSNLQEADFSEAYLKEARFSYSDVSKAKFKDSDLRESSSEYVNFESADLTDADFGKAVLFNVRFYLATLHHTRFIGADLIDSPIPRYKSITIADYPIIIYETYIELGCHAFSYEEFLQDKAEELTRWKDYEKKIFIQNKEEIIKLIQEFNLNTGGEIEISKHLFDREDFLKLTTLQERNKYLRGANLIRADLSSLNLSFLSFSGLDLRGANLRGSDLTDANLTDANFRGAKLPAYLTGAKLPKHKIAKISFYRILIFESHIQVGCHDFSYEEFLQDKAEELTRWKKSEKEFFIQNKEEIIKLIQEFNLNKGEEND